MTLPNGNVSQNIRVVLPDDDPLTLEMIGAKCKANVLSSVYPDVYLAVRHLETPFEMFQKVKKNVVGSEASQKRKLREKLTKIHFKESYFKFLNQFKEIVS